MTDILTAALREITRRPGRSLVLLLGTTISVGLLLVLTNLLWLDHLAKQLPLSTTGTHFLAWLPSTVESPAPWVNNRSPQPLPGGLAERIVGHKAIRDVTVLTSLRIANPLADGSTSLLGMDLDHPVALSGGILSETELVAGQWPQRAVPAQALVDDWFAQTHHIEVGQKLTLGGVPVEVIGRVRPGVRLARADWYLDRESLGSRGPVTGHLLAVEVAEAHFQGEAIAYVRKELPGALVDTYACSATAANVLDNDQNTLWQLVTLVIVLQMLFTVLVCWSGIRERRPDRLILRSLGWPPHCLVWQVCIEWLLPLLLGVLVALLAVGAPLTWSELQRVG